MSTTILRKIIILEKNKTIKIINLLIITTWSNSPVVNDESSDAKKRIAFAAYQKQKGIS